MKTLSRLMVCLVFLVALAERGHTQGASQLYTVQTRPPRGFMPNADQLASPLDSVEPASGKLHVQIPLASLPLGPAGTGYDLDLVYDSSQYYVSPQMIEPPAGSPPNYHAEPAYQLSPSFLGGWAYSIDGYRLENELRQGAEAGTGPCLGSPPESARFNRMRVGLPDGSSHLLYLRGFESAYQNDFPAAEGFIGLDLAGQPSSCSLLAGWTAIPGVRTFYTVDGSYLKVEVEGNGSIWRLYFSDGRRVLHQANNDLQIVDANGNAILVSRGVSTSGFPYTRITDAAGREILITYGGPSYAARRDTITFPGPLGTQTASVWWENRTLTGALEQGGRPYIWTAAPWVSSTSPKNYFGGLFLTVKAVELPLHTTPSGELPPQWSTYEMDYSLSTGYGELNSLRTPSGALYQYVYEYDSAIGATIDGWNNRVTTRTLTKPSVVIGESPETLTWSYAHDIGLQKTTTTAPDTSQTTHWFSPPANYQATPMILPGSLVYRIDEPLGVVRKRVWAENKVPGLAQVGLLRAPQNPYVARETMTSSNGTAPIAAGQTAITAYAIDKNGNPTSERHYDWTNYSSTGPETAPQGLAAKRTIANSYWIAMQDASAAADDALCSNLSQAQTAYRCGYWMPQAATPWLTDKPRRLDAVQRRVVSADGAVTAGAAVTDFEYQEPYGKGNLVKEWRWDNKLNPALPAALPSGALGAANARLWEREYWPNGNVMNIYEPEVEAGSGIRPRAYVEYEPTGSYPSSVAYYWGSGTADKRTWTYEWNTAAGALICKTDADNGLKTRFEYDVVGRPRFVTEGVKDAPCLGSGLRKTETSYNDEQLTVTVKQSLTTLNDEMLQSVTQYDRLGRPLLVTTAEPENANGVKVKAIYRTQANEMVRSTLYRTTADETLEWSCIRTDALKRMTQTSMYKGGTAPAECADTGNRTGRTLVAYVGNVTTITDPKDVVKTERHDVLGRLDQIVEAPGVTDFGYTTSYEYDAFDNLKTVLQGSQTRTFEYTSLGRLDSATNPETGRLDYSYTPSGDLKTRKDALNIISTFTYDAMHRITAKTYTDGTPAVAYRYHASGALGIGQLWQVESAAATVDYLIYDDLGRVTKSQHQVNGAGANTFEYEYFLNDMLKSEKYPSGLVVQYDAHIDSQTGISAGRLGKVTGTYLGIETVYADVTATAPAGAAIPRYTPDGRIAQMKLGNGLWETWNYQTPGTATTFKVGTGGSDDRMQVEYSFAGTQNNGNLMEQTIRRGTQSWTQLYTYDAVNRLETATEASISGGTGWSRAYGYDRYGNRWVKPAGSAGLPYEPRQPSASSNFDVATNRLFVNLSDYDAAGNQTYYAPYALTYDAENRLTGVTSPLIGTGPATTDGSGTYSYDGDGRRVKKVWTGGGSNATTTMTYYVYDAMGALKAEYSTGPTGPSRTFLHADMLGSTRLISDSSGGVIECDDYEPFGRMLSAATNNRPTCYPQSPDVQINSTSAQKFTGKERDAETRLDFFLARYYSAAQGRFTSADPVVITQERLSDPQRLNLFGYARNNPLRFVDPTGKDVVAYEILLMGPNNLPKGPHPGITDTQNKNLGPQDTPRGGALVMNTRAIFEEGDNLADYKPIRTAYVFANGEKRVAGAENPTKNQILNLGNSQFVLDIPSVTNSGTKAQLAGLKTSMVLKLEEQNTKQKGKPISKKKLYYAVSFEFGKDGKLSKADAREITEEDFENAIRGRQWTEVRD